MTKDNRQDERERICKEVLREEIDKKVGLILILQDKCKELIVLESDIRVLERVKKLLEIEGERDKRKGAKR